MRLLICILGLLPTAWSQCLSQSDASHSKSYRSFIHGVWPKPAPSMGSGANLPKTLLLSVPLDHFAKGSATWDLKYYVNDTYFKDGGTMVLALPQEFGFKDSDAYFYFQDLPPWVESMQAVVVAPNHRFFGNSVPQNDSSIENLRYLTVEQNLADMASLIDHVKAQYKTISKVVALGGSYAGASSVWMRKKYPTKVDAAIAHSPVVTPIIDFYQYGVSDLVALSSPDSRCAGNFVRMMQAVNRVYRSNRAKLMRLFKVEHFLEEAVGEVDFLEGLTMIAGLGDVQAGCKINVCNLVGPLQNRTKISDWDYVKLLAGQAQSIIFPNSTALRNEATNVSIADDDRSWLWMKCNELGWFKTSPSSGLSEIALEDLTVQAYLSKCAYIFPNMTLVSESSVAVFNRQFGGWDQTNVTNIFVVDYSDDPWKMATTYSIVERQSWPLGDTQPFMLLTCDGCGHCGFGAPWPQRKGILEQEEYHLNSWGMKPSVGSARQTILI